MIYEDKSKNKKYIFITYQEQKMFFCETIKNNYKYCTCFRQWKTLKLAHIEYESPLLEIYVKPFGADEVILLRLKSGDPIPRCLNFEMMFMEWQHFRIRAIGGTITVVGDCVDVSGTMKPSITNHFPSTCPFSDEDDWNYDMVHKKILRYTADELERKEKNRLHFLTHSDKPQKNPEL